jgi:hypothetical protein
LKKEGRYEILTRTETPRGGLEELTLRPRTELMAVDIVNLSLGSFTGLENEERNERHTLTTSEWSLDEQGDWTTIPKVLKLSVYGTNNTQLINELIYR